MKSNIIRKLSGILTFLIGIPLSLAENETEDVVGDTLRPNLEAGILGLPTEIRDWITWSISVAFLFVIAYKIIMIFKEAVFAWNSKRQNRSRERAEHIENIFDHAIQLIIIIVVVLLVIFIASNI